MSSASGCKGLEDINSTVKKSGGGEGRQMVKFAPNQRKENIRWLSKPSLGFWTAEVAADWI